MVFNTTMMNNLFIIDKMCADDDIFNFIEFNKKK